jgi:hypothetical protein
MQSYFIATNTSLDALQKSYNKLNTTCIQNSDQNTTSTPENTTEHLKQPVPTDWSNELKTSFSDQKHHQEDTPEVTQQSKQNTLSRSYAKVTSKQHCAVNTHKKSSQECFPIPTIVSGRISENNRSAHRQCDVTSQIKIDIIKRKIEKKLMAIKVHMSRQTMKKILRSMNEKDQRDILLEDLVTKIANCIRWRDPKVTKVTIFKNERFGSVAIRANIEDVENANNLLEKNILATWNNV